MYVPSGEGGIWGPYPRQLGGVPAHAPMLPRSKLRCREQRQRPRDTPLGVEELGSAGRMLAESKRPALPSARESGKIFGFPGSEFPGHPLPPTPLFIWSPNTDGVLNMCPAQCWALGEA